VLEVDTRRGLARMSIEDGLPVALRLPVDQADSLGDLLIHEGALDRAAHERALSAIPPRGPVGPWLERVGATSGSALAYVCRRQLRQRMRRLLLDGVQGLRFHAGDSSVGLPALREQASLGVLLMGALRELSGAESERALRARLGQRELSLTELGEALLEGAALWPDEQAMLVPLRAGADADTVWGVAGRSARALRTLAGLMRVEAVASRRRGVAYPMLMQKRRQVRAQVGSRRLLELSDQASPVEARRALRRFARSLHPDHFSDGPLRRASEEVFRAMVHAASELGA